MKVMKPFNLKLKQKIIIILIITLINDDHTKNYDHKNYFKANN